MNRPRITVRRLMILVGVLAVVMFAVRCYRVREYAQRRLAELDQDKRMTELLLRLRNEGIEREKWLYRSPEVSRLWNEDLLRVRLKTRAFEHVVRHPWHALPYDEEVGLTRYEKMASNGQ
jgi:hypothetical protein